MEIVKSNYLIILIIIMDSFKWDSITVGNSQLGDSNYYLLYWYKDYTPTPTNYVILSKSRIYIEVNLAIPE